MLNRSRRLVLATKVGLAGATMFTTLALTLGSDVPSSSAASDSAFCKTLLGFIPTFEKNVSPTAPGLKGFQEWGKLLYPYFSKMASESSGKAKVTITLLAGEFKDYADATNLAKIEAYQKANHAKFEAGTKAFADEIGGCE